MYEKGTAILYPIIYAFDLILYTLLSVIHGVRNCLCHISLAFNTRSYSSCFPILSGKVTSSLPPHVAISCPQISPLTDQHSTQSSREDAIVAIVHRLLLAGVRHVSVHDPAQQIPVAQFCNRLRKNPSQASVVWRTYPGSCHESQSLRICVSHVTLESTTRRQLTLNPPMRSESFLERLISLLPKNRFVDLAAQLTRVHPFCGNEPDPRTTPIVGLVNKHDWEGQLSTVSSDEDSDARLTLIQGWIGHACIVSAARRLAEQRLRDGLASTVQETVDAIDQDPRASVLPSEPDVLIIFPAHKASPVPVLHGFPFWQLRLTQIIFAPHAPNDMSFSTISNMIATSASAPKRFGR